MAIKTYRPVTPSRRFYTNIDSGDITAKASVRSLLVKLPAQLMLDVITMDVLHLAINKRVLKNFTALSISKETSMM